MYDITTAVQTEPAPPVSLDPPRPHALLVTPDPATPDAPPAEQAPVAAPATPDAPPA